MSHPMNRSCLSAYVLTKDSEHYLAEILQQLNRFADEVVVLDSGSQDSTRAIAESAGARFLEQPFTDFRTQRGIAESACRHDFIFFCDCDERPDDMLVIAIQKAKQAGLDQAAYDVQRYWQAYGKPVRVVYPIISPDRVPRLYDRRRCRWEPDKRVHEGLLVEGPRRLLEGRLEHLTFETQAEVDEKLARYTDLAALALVERSERKGQSPRRASLRHGLQAWTFSPLGAVIKSYIVRQGFRDGWVGLRLMLYAVRYSHLKHWKAARQLAARASE